MKSARYGVMRAFGDFSPPNPSSGLLCFLLFSGHFHPGIYKQWQGLAIDSNSDALLSLNKTYRMK